DRMAERAAAEGGGPPRSPGHDTAPRGGLRRHPSGEPWSGAGLGPFPLLLILLYAQSPMPPIPSCPDLFAPRSSRPRCIGPEQFAHSTFVTSVDLIDARSVLPSALWGAALLRTFGSSPLPRNHEDRRRHRLDGGDGTGGGGGTADIQPHLCR